MHKRLVSYLRDNRDQIIENWLTEVDIPAPAGSTGGGSGVVPYEFYLAAFNSVVTRIEVGTSEAIPPAAIHFDQFLGLTCECRDHCFGGRVCMELQEAGLDAFMSVFSEEWDTGHEFSPLDRECSQDLIHHALSGFFGEEVTLCPHRAQRSDCPFTAQTT
jgi:hypothetical protein